MAVLFATGTMKAASLKDNTKYLHVKGNSVENAQPLEILTYNANYANTYRWEFVKNEDNTYSTKNVASGLYIHPKAHTSANGTRLE